MNRNWALRLFAVCGWLTAALIGSPGTTVAREVGGEELAPDSAGLAETFVSTLT